jgi:D-glycero-alpha-D-manno-heptose 1-phosphate guanylyltransferase
MPKYMQEVTGVVLAGGLGTRLRAVVDDQPKVLAEVSGRPFLSYVLDQFNAEGIKRVILCIGYLGEQIREQFGISYRDVELVYSQETELLGTAGALRLALPLLETEIACVMNGDSYCDLDLADFWAWHGQKHESVSLALVSVADTSRYGAVEVAGDDRIVRFAEKDPVGRAGWINAGVYLLPYQLIQEIPENEPVSLERDILTRWIGRGMCGYRVETRFIDIGTPSSYRRAEQFFSSHPLSRQA